MATNRLNNSGWVYDGNGNATSMPALGGGAASLGYDVDNRMVTWGKIGVGTETYGYLADNKRVWKRDVSGKEYVYFYGADGRRLLTYQYADSTTSTATRTMNVYFMGRMIRSDDVPVVTDRLGSVVGKNGASCSSCAAVVSKDYFPYGDEIGTASAGNADKFGTIIGIRRRGWITRISGIMRGRWGGGF